MKANLKHYDLDNGFRVILAKDSSNPILSVQLFIKVGSVHEPAEESGFSHLTEHLVFKSTENYPTNGIMERASFLGANINAYTEFESTCLYLTLPSKFGEDALDILSQLVYKSNYSDEEFFTERNVVIEELKQYENDPEDNFLEKAPLLCFTESPYHNLIIGNLANIENSTPQQLRDFYKKYYIPQNCYLVITGDFEETEIKAQIDKYFGEWQSAELNKLENRKNDYIQDFRVIHVEEKDIVQDMLAFVVPEINESSLKGLALSIITKGFAIGRNSRLHKRLYLKEQLVSGIQVHSIAGTYEGISEILIVPKNNSNLEKISRIFLEEIALLCASGFTADELRKLKVEQENGWKYSFEYMENFASVLGNEELDLGYKEFMNFPTRLAAVDSKLIRDVLHEYYSLDKLKILHLGTKNEKLLALEEEIKNRVEVEDICIIPKVEKITGDYHEHLCENGMKLLIKKVVGKPTVGISLARRFSQLNESLNRRGLTYFMTALMQYGNEKYSYEELLDYCNEKGINFHISNGIETAGVKAKCFVDQVSASIKLMADVIKTPLLPTRELLNLKDSVKSDLRRYPDFPMKDANKKYNQFILGKRSNLILKTGELSDIVKISRKEIVEWHKEFLDLSKMTIAVVGDVDFVDVIREVENSFNFDFTKSKSVQKAAYIKGARKRTIYKNGNDQSIIHIGGFACNSTNRRHNTAFHVLSQIIGGDMNSRLFNELREKQGVAYSVDFDYSSLEDIGVFNNFAVVDRAREEQAIKTIYAIMQDIKDNNVTPEELQLTKNFINGQRLIDNESVIAQADQLSLLSALGYSYDYYLQRENRLNNVSHEDIDEIANSYFNRKDLYMQIYR